MARTPPALAGSADGRRTAPPRTPPSSAEPHATARPASGRSGQDDDEGLSDPSERLLLLLPALGDCDLPAEARGTVARALSRVGIRGDATSAPGRVPAARAGTGRRIRWTVTWTVTDAGPLAACSSPYSPRRVPLALGITPERAGADPAAAAHMWEFA
ncbi:hypothetical protein [Streptomyces xanthophaeus]|uniref:hypothetical protein n=1 Tax=Streptomyces xanthophaeus TaxID=67385 RepID=UPI00233E81D1|nr:hypothetical protein [Streptomyces xanthophaeus]